MKMPNKEENPKYLPLGTLVLVKKNICTLMIVGYLANENEKIKDYKAVYYPYGFQGMKLLVKFNHEDIVSIIHLGNKFEKQEEYNNFLNDRIKEYKF